MFARFNSYRFGSYKLQIQLEFSKALNVNALKYTIAKVWYVRFRRGDDMPKPENRKLSPGENYMRMLNHEIPEWVPIWTVGLPLYIEEPMPLIPVGPSITAPHMPPDSDGIDLFGVKWVGTEETGGAKLPEPNNFILDDITKWRDVIKVPDFSDVDWEKEAKKDLEMFKVDRSVSAVAQNVFIGVFQTFVSFMGFTEGLIAMSEEPEEVEALIHYITDFYTDIAEKYFDYLRPDAFFLVDDTASQMAPFMSEEMFRRFFVPCYKKLARKANEYGIPIQFHNCGLAANFIEICHDEVGVIAWDPAQTMNDLLGFKKKWGREIAIVGGFDPSGDLLLPDCPDELIRQAVRDTIDTYAPDGGYAFCGMFVGPIGDENLIRKEKVLEQEVIDYGATFYD